MSLFRCGHPRFIADIYLAFEAHLSNSIEVRSLDSLERRALLIVTWGSKLGQLSFEQLKGRWFHWWWNVFLLVRSISGLVLAIDHTVIISICFCFRSAIVS